MKAIRITLAILLTIFTIWYILQGLKQVDRFKNHSEIK